MPIENRRRLREPREPSDPLETGARARLTDSSAVLERSQERGLSEGARMRASRPSIRPSAFGIPRQRHAEDPGGVTTAVERPSARPSMPITPSEPPRVSQTVRKKQPSPERPAVKTDIEELLPISQGVKSLPLPPKLPTFEAPQLPAPTNNRRFPVMSLSIFAVVLGASLAPLARYRVERTAEVTREPVGAHEVDWASLAPLAHEPLWGEPVPSREHLLEEGERALNAGDASTAEHAFVQALSFGIDNPDAAFGLARVRFAQGDLQGARGWAEDALRRRPQDAQYRGFLDELRSRRKR